MHIPAFFLRVFTAGLNSLVGRMQRTCTGVFLVAFFHQYGLQSLHTRHEAIRFLKAPKYIPMYTSPAPRLYDAYWLARSTPWLHISRSLNPEASTQCDFFAISSVRHLYHSKPGGATQEDGFGVQRQSLRGVHAAIGTRQ